MSATHLKRYEDPAEREKTGRAVKKHHKEHPETREKHSAALQGIPYEEWTGFTPHKRDYVTPVGRCAHLNEWFKGCRQHHVDPDTIIHIPAQMHIENWHNIKTGKGMDVINAMAFEYLFSG